MTRRGKTLLELMIAITIVATVLTLCGRTLTAMMRSDRTQAAALLRTSRTARLAELFRADVHACERAELVAAPDGAGEAERELRLVQPGGRIVAYAAGARVERTVRDGDRRVAYEAWPLEPLMVRFELADEDRVATLVAEAPIAFASQSSRSEQKPSHDETRGAGPPRLRVQTRVGFDHRFRSGGPQ